MKENSLCQLKLKAIKSAFSCLEAVPHSRKATVFIDRNNTVVISRLFKFNKRSRNETVVVTCGKPNYLNRQRIKDYVKAGEPFPVKRPLIEYWPKPTLRTK